MPFPPSVSFSYFGQLYLCPRLQHVCSQTVYLAVHTTANVQTMCTSWSRCMYHCSCLTQLIINMLDSQLILYVQLIHSPQLVANEPRIRRIVHYNYQQPHSGHRTASSAAQVSQQHSMALTVIVEGRCWSRLQSVLHPQPVH